MKKLTLLLVATLMIGGAVIAQDKACCKKGAKGSCCKGKKECTKGTSKTTGSAKTETAKPKA